MPFMTKDEHSSEHDRDLTRIQTQRNDMFIELTRLREENARLREVMEQVKASLIAHNLDRNGCSFDFGENFGGTFDLVNEVLS